VDAELQGLWSRGVQSPAEGMKRKAVLINREGQEAGRKGSQRLMFLHVLGDSIFGRYLGQGYIV
jgi:hypothetical protein